MIRISTKDLPDTATMAHVAARSGAFTSVTQARKNGWDGPITLGVHRITKKITVEVVDRALDDGDQRPADRSYRPDLEPGFWSNYVPPEPGSLAWAIQFPMDHNFADRIVGAYVREYRARAKKAVDIGPES